MAILLNLVKVVVFVSANLVIPGLRSCFTFLCPRTPLNIYIIALEDDIYHLVSCNGKVYVKTILRLDITIACLPACRIQTS